jgi:regulator of RNase E activity RraA
MNNQNLYEAFSRLSTPLLADACLRLKAPYRVAPTGIRPVTSRQHIAGQVLPVKHFGSVDVFLEAMGISRPGDVLVIDNGGRTDEGCIGDLTVLEARACKLAGMILWGCHRDTAELLKIQFPVFSYGACPSGPQRLDPRDPDALDLARFGEFTVGREDVAFADLDGCLFIAAPFVAAALDAAADIAKTERTQSEKVQSGEKLRDQFQFAEYMIKRNRDPSYTFRDHLKSIGKAIEA